jgi:LPXTG-site transpeptidase (sortase) family protein
MKITHRQVNNVLTVLIVLFGLYIIVTPYLPSLKWIFRDETSGAPYVGALRGDSETDTDTKPVPAENRIVIPTALIDQPILEGSGIWVIDNGGSWRKNLNTTSPKESGNTIIVGHRFTYARPEDGFYHLDKVKVGDRLALYWRGEELLYEVIETKTVPESAVEIERNSSDRILTLYTCTPVLTAENRLVVIARPVEVTTE